MVITDTVSRLGHDQTRVTLEPSGEIDAGSVDELADMLQQAVCGGAHEVDVDLREVTFMDTTALRVLVTITAHYLRPGKPGPVTVEVQPVKAGKTFATMRADLLDTGGRPVLSLLGTFGTLGSTLDASEHHELVGASPPEMPSFVDSKADQPAAPPSGFMGKVDLRLHPDDAAFATGKKSGSARVRGWFDWPEGHDGEREVIDTIALLQATDAFPPTIFNVELPVGWVPTVELTAHVRARPAPGPLRCEFTTRFVTGGFLEEDGEVWDSTGRLVAQSRQLALVPRA